MISYEPLWHTLEKKQISSYALTETYGFCKGTVQRLRKNMPVTARTLDELCQLCACPIEDVMKIVLEPGKPLARSVKKAEKK